MSASRAAYTDHIAQLSERYGRAITECGYDALIIASGTASAKNRFDDQFWPMSPTPSFLHWLPLEEPHAFLVLRPGARPHLIRTVVDDYWEILAAPASDHFWSFFDVTNVSAEQVPSHFPTGKVAVISRDDETALPGEVNPPALIRALDQARTHKTEYERQCIAEASRRAVRGHRRTAELFAAGDPSELELHLAYLTASQQDDPATPYKGIVALGDHAAVLHYTAYESQASGRSDTSLLVDAGAKYLGYCADITRSYVRGNSESARRFGDLLMRMGKLQHELCEHITVGMEFEALHDHAHQLLASLLLEMAIARGSAAELVERGVTRALFPHGLGHSLGIVTHDVGMKLRAPRKDNVFLRNTSQIEVGHVFTVEPGIYFIRALLAPLRADSRAELLDWTSIDALAPFGGIRIEDNVAITADGIVNFTRQAFADAPAA
jgi:Xaa-Pro dipeptidase